MFKRKTSKQPALGNLVATCIFSFFAATLASASGSFVFDGELYVKSGEHSAISNALPVKPHDALGEAAGQQLFTVQQAAPLAYSDVMGAEIDLWTAVDGDAFPLTSEESVFGAQWNETLERIVYWTEEKNVISIDRKGGSRQVLARNAVTPALSPDGLQLAYVSTPESWAWDDHSKAFEIHVLHITTGKDRVLLRGTDAHQLIWTPDGRFLIFQSGGSGVTSLFRVDTLGEGETLQLTNHGLYSAKSPYFVENPSRNTDVSWSKDGLKLLYGAAYSEAGEIMVLEFNPRYEVRRALQLTHGHSPRWLDNSTVLVPRPGMVSLDKAKMSEMHLAEFPLDAEFAERVVDVAKAPRSFERPEVSEAPVASTKAVSKYRYPLHSSAGYPFTAYYDNRSGGGVLDWKCGGATYNGHRGTDIGVNGWWVYAGAYGSLWSWNDGCPTTGFYGSACGGGFGNYIKLSHGSASGRNWYTTYAHFRNATVKAQTHNCGSRVGVSGSSGNSTGPHLHFQVDAYGYPNDDPFSGSCSGPVSYWCNQNGGNPTTSCC